MAVRDLAIFGVNLQEIYNRLLANQDLCKLLYYTDKDPLSHEDFLDTQILLGNEIRIVPIVGEKIDAKTIMGMKILEGVPNENSEFQDINLIFDIYLPLTQWVIKGTNFRIFAIMSEIRKSLLNKSINGLGKLKGGRFKLEFMSPDIMCYTLHFVITDYV